MEAVVLISDVVFIKRGVPKATPDKVELDTEQIRELIEGGAPDETSGNETSDEEDMEGAEGQGPETEKKGLRGSAANSEVGEEDMDEESMMKEVMKEYEEEEKEGKEKNKSNPMKGVAVFANPMDDPYVTKHTDSDEEEEKDDFIVRPDDNFVVAAKVDKGHYTLEVRVFNEADGDFYVHHDYVLEAPPLCLEPFSYDPGSENKQGNLLAVGTMAGAVEIWDLDIVNSCAPAIIFGGSDEKKKRRKKRDGSSQGHTEAVLSCKWNQNMPHVLASGDAAGNLVLWDIDEAKPATVISALDQGGLQSLHWHPVESSVLLGGTMGGFVNARDCRTEQIAATWSLGSEVQVEKVLWDHFSPFHALVASDDGKLRYVDMRQPGAFLHTVDAHEGGVEAIGMSCGKSGLVASGGADGSLAIWSATPGALSLVHRVNLSLGAVHSLAFSPNSPTVVVVGGDAEDLTRVIDLATYHEQIAAAFPTA